MGRVIAQQAINIGLVLLLVSVWQGVSDVPCGPVCAIYCEYGNVMDDAGCPTCSCEEREPAPPVTTAPSNKSEPDTVCCLDGYTLGLVQGGTVQMCIGPSGDVTQPFACNKPLTSNPCRRCRQSCTIEGGIAGLCDLNGQCSVDYDAVNRSCSLEPDCPPVCEIACEFGNVMDDAGCPTCSCEEREPATPITAVPLNQSDTNTMCCLDGYTLGLLRNGSVQMCVGPSDDVKDPFACNKSLTSNPCHRCWQSCTIEGGIAGLCDLNGQCSVDYDAVNRSCSLKPECPPVCEIFCEFGNIMDDAGCPTCSCKEHMPAAPETAAPYNQSEANTMCCLDGYTLGLLRNGSVQMCVGPSDDVTDPFACNEPLTSNPCSRCGQSCTIEGDIAGLCDLDGQCSHYYDAVNRSCSLEPECPPVCAIFCEFGNIMDDAGCPTCACKVLSTLTVQGSLLLDVAEASRVVSSRNLHHIFVRVIAKLAGVGKSSVQITVSALRRLTQFLAASDIPRSLQQAQVVVAFTCDSASQLQAAQIAQRLSGTSSGTVKAAIDKELVALKLDHSIVVISMEAQVKFVPQKEASKADSNISAMVVYLVCISGGLLVCCAVCTGCIGLLHWVKTDAQIVVIKKVLSPLALGANSVCVEDNPVILADTAKESNAGSWDDVSTDVSANSSRSSDKSVDSIKA